MGRRGRARARRQLEAAERTFGEIRDLLERALTKDVGDPEVYCWVRDLTDTWVVWEVSGGDESGFYRAEYSIDDAGAVSLGEAGPVEARTEYQQVTEAVDRIGGRVLEAIGDTDAAGRVFRVEVINFGESRNRRIYPEAVLREAVSLYEGAKAYDHHRTDQELATSTTVGLVGSFRNVEATGRGLEADLHLLPSAVHTAEALDASLEAEANGLPPLVGISHDVLATWRPVVASTGQRFTEAVKIQSVNSADVVADPAAGGRATRMVAGGTGHLESSEEDTVTLAELLELIDGASDEDRADLVKRLGLDVPETPPATPPAPTATGEGEGEGEGAEGELVGAATESWDRGSLMGRRLIRDAIEDKNLDGRLAESVAKYLPERFTEGDLTRVLEAAATMAEDFERGALRPGVPHVEVTREEFDGKVERLAESLGGNYRDGYRSLRAAYADITGAEGADLISAELPFAMIREAYAGGPVEGQLRSTESLTTGSWGEALADSITRRLVAEYNLATLADWRKLVSDVVPVNDFRTQRRDRIGGYGVLPTVAEGGTYQALTSPGDEEATYAITKKGGTEDLTLEMVANDDLGAVARIPKNLGRAAALTLYRFVLFTLLADNPTLTYDATALFAAGHANTDTGSALAQATLSVGRRKMREQARYGVSTDVLGIVPKYLVVPPELEEIAFQLATSAVAIPSTPAGPTDTPNIHQGLEPIVVDQFTDANDWYLVADPSLVPTIEVGFFQGRQEPELFVQDDPKVGSNFSADKMTYKIRHIYSGTVLEHRAFYRGQG